MKEIKFYFLLRDLSNMSDYLLLINDYKNKQINFSLRSQLWDSITALIMEEFKIISMREKYE